jgi:hypothetical protein
MNEDAIGVRFKEHEVVSKEVAAKSVESLAVGVCAKFYRTSAGEYSVRLD